MQVDIFDMTEQDLQQFKDRFDKREWARLEDRLELIFRDRAIRRKFVHKREMRGQTYDQAIRELSKEYHLSESQISHIVYPRKRDQL